MSWTRESLWSKSKLFFEKGFDEDKEELYFGLWCSMGLELLARSAIAKVSPTLLADPDHEQQNLLHALGLGSAKTQKKSISTIQVLTLCKKLIPEFTDEYYKAASALIGRRNDEVHTGTAAFLEYPTQQWIGGFYKCCQILAESQNESLLSLFGEEIANEGQLILSEIDSQILSNTKSLIAAHKKVYDNLDKEERIALADKAKELGSKLSHINHHRVDCPACGCVATVQGEASGKENIEHTEREIIVRQSIVPTKFNCTACGLKLSGYGSLSSAGVADHFTKRISYSPEEYYDMINPNDYDAIASRYEDQIRENTDYNNE